MKTFPSFCCVLTMLLSCLPVFSQQPNTKVLRNWELVDTPFQPSATNTLLGSLKVDGGFQPPRVAPEFDELSSVDIKFQNNSNNNIEASATIFSFLTGRFKKADSKFQLTEMPDLKIFRVRDVPLVLQNMGMNAGKVVTAYAVAQSFTVCSDKVSEWIAQGSTTGGTPTAPRSATNARNCQQISKAALDPVPTGMLPAPQQPTTNPPAAIPNEEQLKNTIAENVVKEFNKLGLQNIAATVDLQNQTVRVVSSEHPVVVAWQLVQYDPRKISRNTITGKFASSDVLTLSDGGRPVYKIDIGTWDETTVRAQNLSPDKPLCVYFKVTDVASNLAFEPVTYCPQLDELPGVDTSGYVRNANYRTKELIPLSTFLSNNSLVKPKLTIGSPVFAYTADGIRATANIQIEELKTNFKLVKK